MARTRRRAIKCENCYYYVDVKNDDYGQCRKSRPVIDGKGRTIWPAVKCDDWCGRFDELVGDMA